MSIGEENRLCNPIHVEVTNKSPIAVGWFGLMSAVIFAGCKTVHYHGRALVKHWVVKGLVFSRGINIQLPKYLGAIPLLPPLHAALHCLPH